MDPTKHSDHPMKDSMNMAYVPVYASSSRTYPGLRIDPRMVQALGVRLATVQERPLGHEIDTVGTIVADARRRYDVNLRVSGWITELVVQAAGDPVRKGQLLARVYAPELYAAESEYLIARQQFKVLGQRRLEEAAAEKLSLLGMSQAEIASLTRQRHAQKFLSLRAPQDGTVLALGVRSGSYVTPGTTLFQVADLSRVWAKIALYSYQLPWVAVGDPVTLRLAHDPQQIWKGHVQFLYPTLDSASRTVEARVVLENRGGRLRPGMYINAIVRGTPKTALAVPADAVLRSAHVSYVMVAQGAGHFLPTEVLLGPEADGWVEVRRGLMSGDQVATNAQFLLYSESQMQQIKARMLGPDPGLNKRDEPRPEGAQP